MMEGTLCELSSLFIFHGLWDHRTRAVIVHVSFAICQPHVYSKVLSEPEVQNVCDFSYKWYTMPEPVKG